MQKIINGIDNLPGILQEIGCKKLLLVIDSSYPFLNIKDTIENLPVAEKIKFSNFTPNPLYEQVCEGIELFKSSQSDTILAVGGGSVIDTAKAAAMGISYDGDVWDFFTGKAVPEKVLPIGAVSTIPASGS